MVEMEKQKGVKLHTLGLKGVSSILGYLKGVIGKGRREKRA